MFSRSGGHKTKETYPTRPGSPTPYKQGLRAYLHEGGGPHVGEVTCGGLPHLTCKRDNIKMRDCMDRRVTPPKQVTSPTWGPPLSCKQALRAYLHEGGGPHVGEVTCGGLPHLTCKRDNIKMRDCMDRRVTPPKQVTSPTWGPPPPCKQALRAYLHEGGGPHVGEVTCGGLPHLTCKRDSIKMRDCMDRRATPPKQVTSPTWGPPPPCKQALR